MTTIPVLRGTTRTDLLALPSFMFEFHPTESVVVLGMRGNIVAFSARLDVHWFHTHFDQVAEQMHGAAGQMGADLRAIVLGYSENPDLAWASVTELCDVFGADNVLEALVTDGSHYWSLTDGEGPLEFDFESSSVAARAVYEGINIHESRDAAVAPVTTWAEPPAQAVEDATSHIAGMTPAAAMELLASLAESDPPVGPDDALTLACLLADEDRCAALLTRLSRANAQGIWANLVAARGTAPAFAEPTVVALLGIACWLAGHGAQTTACLEQVARMEPDHPVGLVLARVHQGAIPPERWDEE